jgi:hypothetical protein
MTDEQVLTVTSRSHFRLIDSVTQAANVRSRKLIIIIIIIIIIIDQ